MTDATTGRDKLDPVLLLWLDGEATRAELGLLPPDPPEADEVRVAVELGEPAADDAEAAELGATGLAVEPGMPVAFGQVTREGLQRIAADRRVARVTPERERTLWADAPPLEEL
jgi:hypothetical protein